MPYLQLSTASKTQKIEMLLFKSGNQLFASRTQKISGLVRQDVAPTATLDLIPNEIELPLRLEQALLGLTKEGHVPIFSLSALLNLEEAAEFSSNMVVLTYLEESIIGLAVEEVFEVQSFDITQIKLLPALIERNLIRPTVWAILYLNTKLKGTDESTSDDTFFNGQLLTLLDFPGLFTSDEQDILFKWMQ